MKTLFITSILLMGIITSTFTQEIDFSVNLANDGRVHTNNSTVVDKDGNIFVAGGTREGLKVIGDAFQKEYNGDSGGRTGGDIYLMKLSPEGELIYSTFIGIDKSDNIKSISSLDKNNILIAGYTKSSDFPVTPDALNKKYNGGSADGFITKFIVKTNELVYSSFIGGTGNDRIMAVEVLDKRRIALIGRTGSKDFPITEDAFQDSIGGGVDLVVLKLDKTLKNIEYSTYLGGSKHEYFPKASCTSNNELVIAFTSTSSDFPISIKYAEKDSTNMNVLVKIDLSN